MANLLGIEISRAGSVARYAVIEPAEAAAEV